MSVHKCTVCSSEVRETYCASCGQKKGGKPTNLLRLFLDFVEQVISIQKSDFATMLNIVKRPRFIVDNYYNGNTGYYSSPGKVMLFAILILIIHMSFITNLILGLDFTSGELNLEYTFLFLFVVLFALTSQIVFFRSGFLLSKHLIAATYIVSTFITFSTFLYWLLLLIMGGDDYLSIIGFLLSSFIWFSLVFTKKRNFINYFLNLLFLIIAFFIVVIAITSFDIHYVE